MKTIKKDDLYRTLSEFFRSKGIELKNGVYPQRISRACDLLTDAINETRKTVRHAKGKVNEKLDQLRQSIHNATAPKPPHSGKKNTSRKRSKPSPQPGKNS